MLGEIEVAAVGHALELRPADRIQVLDVAGAGRVVRELLGVVGAQAQPLAVDAEPHVPVQPLRAPELVPLLRLVGRDEELHLHLLELERAEDEVARRDLVAERLPHLGDAERRPPARVLQRLLEVEEDALRRLRAQIDRRAGLLHRADRGLEHQVEVARLGEVALLELAGVHRGLARAGGSPGCDRPGSAARRSWQSISGSVKPARWPEASHVRGCWMIAESRRDDVVALLHHRPPPGVRHVALEQDAVVPVVIGVGDAAVDL